MSGPSINTRSLREFRAAISECLLRDRPRLVRRLAAMRRQIASGNSPDGSAAKLEKEIHASRQIIALRQGHSLSVNFPEALPVSKARAEIEDAISAHPVVIVCGETGSGKTTQLPKICLEMGRGILGQIGHTQPRRIAARSVARRIAAELVTEPGQVVGYQTRFDKSVNDASRVKLMTDGILLSELRHDQLLRQYDTLIIDEAHERSLNIDFLLGYLHTLIRRRKDLKLIITSATIDTEKFSRHFGAAPVLEISGRTFPVDIEYLAEDADEEANFAELVAEAVASLLARQRRRGRGDILVFLPGERAISECRDLLRRRFHEQLEVLPLFGRLSARDQDRVFRNAGKTRCVLATNIAETSLTVPGIRYVVDTGLARVSRYSVRNKVQQLPIEKISRASARQRAGRCGRLENGLCLRLYSEPDYLGRPEHTEPEILRTNLARVILEMATLRLGDIERFPFVDKPDGRFVRDGYRLLQELQAVDEDGKLLAMGRAMARLPVDPRIARILLAASEHGCMANMLVVAAALSVPDPRQRPADKREAADAAHGKFADPRSDFVALLNLWNSWRAQQQDGSGSALRRWCKVHFLSYSRMREWQDLVHQLHGLSADTRKAAGPVEDDYAALHQALLTGLLGHVGLRNDDGAYRGTRGRVFHVFPGSGTGKKASLKWIVAAQLIETSRLFAHIVARVRPDWIEAAAGHLVKRSYEAPAWQVRRGCVVAKETVTLYGLVLAAGRIVDYGAVDAEGARRVFIREALVGGALGFEVSFLTHNQQLVAQIRALEDRSRRRDVLADEDVQWAFYHERLPPGLCDAAGLRRWLRRAEPGILRGLQMERNMLMRHAASEVTAERFPSQLQIGSNRIALEYNFDRGSTDDGVTALIPLKLLNQVPAGAFDTLVPGLLQEKVEAMLRGLPKKLRRNLVPVPRFAQAALEDLPSEAVPLSSWLADKLHRMSGTPVTAAELAAVELPLYLRMNLRLVNDAGEVLAEGRDLQVLRKQFGKLARRAASQGVASELGRSGIRRWDFGALPERVDSEREGRRVVLFPALNDDGESVSLVFHDDAAAASTITLSGLVRLAQIALPQQFELIRKDIRSASRALLGWQRYGNQDELAQQIFFHLARGHFQQDSQSAPRTEAAFRKLLDAFRSQLTSEASQLIILLTEILDRERTLRRRLETLGSQACAASVADASSQLARLLHPVFVSDTEPRWLARYPVYLEALEIRLERLPGRLEQDLAGMARIAPGEQQLAMLENDHPDWLAHASAREFRWLIEELRVSVFAQKLGTVCKISTTRLQRFWEQEIAGPMLRAGHLPGD